MMPQAYIAHQCEGRLRLRIPSERGNPSFFNSLEESLAGCPQVAGIRTCGQTASVLLWGPGITIDAVATYAASHGIFGLSPMLPQHVSLAQTVAQPIQQLNTTVNRFTGGDIDISGLFFLSLLGVGIYELVRGNFKTPPWYTAFWYAFGVFSKSIMDHVNGKTVDPG